MIIFTEMTDLDSKTLAELLDQSNSLGINNFNRYLCLISLDRAISAHLLPRSWFKRRKSSPIVENYIEKTKLRHAGVMIGITQSDNDLVFYSQKEQVISSNSKEIIQRVRFEKVRS